MNRFLFLAMAPALAALPAVASAGVRPLAALMPGSPPMHSVSGTVQRARSTVLTIRMRDGRMLEVDATQAVAHAPSSRPTIGKSFVFEGQLIAGDLIATKIGAVANGAQNWPPDR
jgi:hypothetical protein